ncbi:MAG: carboxymuconolactone decarboxylase family protein [Polyangiales bacterium]
MSRIVPHTVESAPAAAQPFLERAQKASGYLSNLLGTLAHAPTALEAYVALGDLNARGSLRLAEREVVQLAAATLHGCTFCVAGHTALALDKAKLAPSIVTALRAQAPLDDPRLEQLARFTRAVIAHRGRVPEPAYQAFLAADFTAQQALEVVLGVALATLCNFANSFAETALNEQLSAHAWTLPSSP